MISREPKNIQLNEDNGQWILVLERTLPHPRTSVFSALTKADEIPKWGPFTTNRDFTTPGPVQLAHINMPEAGEVPGEVLEVKVPELLVFQWGPDVLRWELTEVEDGTLLVLRHRFANRKDAPSFAAGWHLCIEGLAGILDGKDMPSMAGHNAMKYGWEELYKQYAEKLGIELS